MNKLIIASLAALLATAASAQTESSFKRPDCSAFQGTSHLPESKCFREAKLAVRYENYAALQKTGLEFVYMARPPAELDAYPEARKAAEDKIEGEFLIKFSVNAEGNVYDVKVVNASSAPIGHLAKVWADTIAQWKFARVTAPVTDVPFRRLYLYSKEDDDSRDDKSRG